MESFVTERNRIIAAQEFKSWVDHFFICTCDSVYHPVAMGSIPAIVEGTFLSKILYMHKLYAQIASSAAAVGRELISVRSSS